MVKGLASLKARLDRIPKRVKDAVGAQIEVEANDLAAAVKRAAPVDEKAKNPGALRDSVHVEDNPRRPLSKLVVVDGRDEHGHVIAMHVETGHRAKDGTHVAAQPFARPTYRARKKGMRRRIAGKALKAFKES